MNYKVLVYSIEKQIQMANFHSVRSFVNYPTVNVLAVDLPPDLMSGTASKETTGETSIKLKLSLASPWVMT